MRGGDDGPAGDDDAEDVEKRAALARSRRRVWSRVARGGASRELGGERGRRGEDVLAVRLDGSASDSIGDVGVGVVRVSVEHGREVDAGEVSVALGGVREDAEVGVHGEVRETNEVANGGGGDGVRNGARVRRGGPTAGFAEEHVGTAGAGGLDVDHRARVARPRVVRDESVRRLHERLLAAVEEEHERGLGGREGGDVEAENLEEDPDARRAIRGAGGAESGVEVRVEEHGGGGGARGHGGGDANHDVGQVGVRVGDVVVQEV